MAGQASVAAATSGTTPESAVDERDAIAPTQAAGRGARRPGFLLWLVVAAFALRAVAAVALHEVSLTRGGDGFLFNDDRVYDQLAWEQAQAWRGDDPAEGGVGDLYLDTVYTETGAALYSAVGHRPLALKLLNGLFGALTAGLVYLIARRLFGPRAAALAGVAAALFPSTFLWSLTTLRDPMFVFAAALLLWLLTELLATGRWRLVVPVLAVFALASNLRLVLQPLFALVVPAAVALQSRARLPRKWPLAGILTLGCAALLWVGSAWWLVVMTPERLNQQRGYAAIGAESGIVSSPEDHIGTTDRSVQGLLAWLPTGLAYTLAAPFPWAADRAAERAALPEVAAWYAAVALALAAVARHWREWRRWAHLAGFVGGVVLLLALTAGNLGTLVRHRGMAIPFVLVFSGAGAAWLWAWWQSRRRTPAAARLDAASARPATTD